MLELIKQFSSEAAKFQKNTSEKHQKTSKVTKK